MALQDDEVQNHLKEFFEHPQFTLTECAVCNDGPGGPSTTSTCTCCTGTQCPATDDGAEIFFTALVSMCGCAARNTCASVGEDTVPGCHYTYRDVSWADAIGITGGYVALVDSIFTMMIIIIYLTCTGQPPAAVVSSPPLSRQLITLVCPRVSVHKLWLHRLLQ
jgi:hypothetical protein